MLANIHLLIVLVVSMCLFCGQLQRKNYRLSYYCRELQHLRGGDRADPRAEPLHTLRLPPLRHVRLHELGNIQYSCLRPGRVKEGGI